MHSILARHKSKLIIQYSIQEMHGMITDLLL